MALIEKTFTNNELEIELTSYIDNKQNIWFKGKKIAKILEYEDPSRALRRHIDPEDKFQRRGGGGQISPPFIDTPGANKRRFSIMNPVFTRLIFKT